MTSSAVGRLGWLQIDCTDPQRLAQFWSGVLGLGVRGTLGGTDDEPQYVFLEASDPSSPRLCFQRVPEAKSVKNRLHLDIAVTDIERASRDVLGLGANPVPDGDKHEYGMHWRILADPEGNEFCLVQSEG